MNYKDAIKTIKSKGYWEIIFEPDSFNDKLLDLNECKELIENNSVKLRGWDYPHFPKRFGDDTDIDVGDSYYQGWLDWAGENHKEFWRMYQSGQFVHYLALREDWSETIMHKSLWEQQDRKYGPGETLWVISTTYLMTEIHLFLSRLIKNNVYNDKVNVNITLHSNSDSRVLLIDNYSRIGFTSPKKTTARRISYLKTYETANFETKFNDYVLESIIYIFERFGWNPPNVDVIKMDISNFLIGKL